MTVLWPRLSATHADVFLPAVQERREIEASPRYSKRSYGELGSRVDQSVVEELRDDVVALMKDCKGRTSQSRETVNRDFDAEAAFLLRRSMRLSLAEAANPSVWNYMSLCLLPDVTAWRWGASTRATVNVERWLCSDQTRHTWSRCWWMAELLPEPDLLSQLNEVDRNQFFERTFSLGSRQRLLGTLVPEYLKLVERTGGAGRTEVVRELGKRVVREAAFINLEALTAEQLTDWARRAVMRVEVAGRRGRHAAVEEGD